MLNTSDAVRLAEVRDRTLSALREAIGDARDVAVLDAPNQRNVGDSLIWQGELAYLEMLGLRIRYVSDLNGFDAADLRRRLPRSGVVLLHGGGNFGDLWIGHQEHRETLAAELADYRLVQLSQSIFFADEGRAAIANRVIGAHPDFTLLLRDGLSMERAATMLPDVRRAYCPDMALGYDAAFPAGGRTDADKVLVIARADRESASGLRGIPQDWLAPHRLHVTDWGQHRSDPLGWRLARTVLKLQRRLVAARRRLPVKPPTLPQALVQRAVRLINESNVDSAVSLYSSARAVAVDRLHAHVLAMLLGLGHVMLDNNYRKLGAVFDDYTGVFSTANYATDLDEARARLYEILES
ncbi:polysaccharide pyruvyl transferase family protein [Microbacterium marinilacus]|uniref:Polysaccharide pyruvyl transferase family protein n=1 Tax=Microbacterium marinilacus TaxID=415209 RepID=A0ABP7BDS1_9MICO